MPEIHVRLTKPPSRNIIASIRGSERWVAGFKSERWPASDRNRWPASYWNAWPASSESALLLANDANREGMHANALVLTRQCVESISVIELGICGHQEAEAVLVQWNDDQLTPGKLRKWLEHHVWPRYGSGLWTEPWSEFMREFAGAVQPYAHYGPSLAQWQVRLHGVAPPPRHAAAYHAVIEMKPRAYDPQKATRITLFHAILTYALGRVWLAAHPDDKPFAALVNRLRVALGKSPYLDGHETDWSQQFWAMMWSHDGNTILE